MGKPKKKISRAETIRRELQKIESEGPLTPERIVKAAKPKHHPLHSCFEWEPEKAAHEYRLWQARQLVAVYLVEYIGGEEQRTHISVTTEEGRAYVPKIRVVSDTELLDQATKYILGMIKHWKKQYKFLKDTLEDMEKLVRKRRRKKK